jgi:thiol-disulfide isomerase/thioredoxin
MEVTVQTRRNWIRTVVMVFAGLAVSGSSAVGIAQTPKAISVRIVDKSGYDKIIASSKGKVVVVDCWATWCVPCRKAFPKTVELSKTYAEQGLVVVSLSFDDPVKGQVPDKVKEFLVKQNAHFENLVSSLEISDTGAEVFAIPEGALPHFKIYGRDGKEFTHEEIEEAVKAALKAK